MCAGSKLHCQVGYFNILLKTRMQIINFQHDIEITSLYAYQLILDLLKK
jgi:hypothetical protein